MKKDKIIMIVTNRFDPDIRVFKEAKYMVSKGYDVEILCWDRENEYKNKEIEVLEGIKVRRFFPFARYGSGLKQLRGYINFIIEIKKFLKKIEFKYIHCHDLDGVIVGYLVKSRKEEIIFDMHEIYEINGKNRKFRYIFRIIVGFFQNISKSIIYVNELQKDFMRKSNKKKAIFLPNYPDIENFRDVEKTYSKALRISYIGSVRQFNELKKLMDACKDIENLNVYIHGAGVAYDKLLKINEKYNNVHISGRYHPSKSNELYNQTDVLYALYPNSSLQYQTSYPIKLFEAIITKTPIVVSKGTVLEEFVQKHDIGFVVEGDNISNIKKLIISINENRNILMEKQINLEKIQYDYSWKEVVKNLDSAYEG